MRTPLEQRLDAIVARYQHPTGGAVLPKDLRDELNRLQHTLGSASSEVERAYVKDALDLWERRLAERMATAPAPDVPTSP